ncbi:RNA polymerase sigma factor [uncultured Duncaniella sp.]|uniref:RNA polymerase sigma factor n=2 Tax=uncultured Duncaniella sp. TaxID=2768039 RepID=UPI0026197449|nr:sigma-70 family RNA polymerase sigma factor [uncultured Duncaniella sp.]
MPSTSSEGINVSERELMDLVSSGDPAAGRMIYQRYVRNLVAVCSRYILNDEDVKDVLQESFIRIFDSLPAFRFRGEGSLRAWMTKVTVNEALKFIRNHRRIDFTSLPPGAAELPDDEPEIESVPAEVIHDLICRLPDGYRMIFNLYVIEGRSHKEIAGMLDIKESTSASQLHRAKAMLADSIRKYQNSLIR